MLVDKLRIAVSLAFLSFAGAIQAQQFLGAGFGVYIGDWTGNPPTAAVPLYNSYNQTQVRAMVNTASTEFKYLATYSAGYASYYAPTLPWNQVDSAWRIGSAAASINKAAGKKKIDIAQGIFQQDTSALMNAEIDGAFKIAANANKTFDNTVSKLIFTNEYVTSAATCTQVTGLIQASKARAKTAGLKLGVRSNTFGVLTNPSSPYYSQMQTLVKNCDFIMCNIYPGKQESAAAAVTDVSTQFAAIEKAALKLNPKVEVMIGETGWPSQGISFNNTVNNVKNQQAFFQAIRTWAQKNKVYTYWFEAIDEPWKSNKNSTDTGSFQGPNGAEGHYGIWFATKTATGYKLTRKFGN